MKTERVILILIYVITFLAFAIRLYELDYESISLDEISTTIAFSEKNITGILMIAAGGTNPPMYYILMHFVLLLGNSELVVRLPSVVFAVMSIPLIFLLASTLFGRFEGVVSAVLLSISGFHISWSQQARPYAMLVFLSLISMYSLYLWLEKDNKKALVIFTIATAISIYTQYYTIFILPIALMLLLLNRKKAFLDDNNAVSPVIGVVLMVAITVIMAAIIKNWSSGISALDIPKQVSVTIIRGDEFIGTMTVTSIRPEGTTIQQLTVINESVVLSDVGNALEGFGNGTSSPGGITISVGDTFTGPLFGHFDEHIVVVATFGDGTEATIFDSDI